MEMRPTATQDIFGLVECLAGLATQVKGSWQDSIDVEFELGADVVLSCSRGSFESAILHLLLNARDATPSGGSVSVLASVVRDERAEQRLEISVRDYGFGMTGETLLHATDPYFTTKTTGLGGLGLPIVGQFAEDAGGRLHLDSALGLGTTATLRLPLQQGLSVVTI